MKIEFNEDDVDFLQELLNIAFGSATAIVSDMLETFATLHIPHIEIVDTENLQNYINNNFDKKNQYFVFSQQFRGDLEGEAVFISDLDSLKNLYLTLNSKNEEIEDIIESTGELINVVNSATIKNIANQLEKEVFFSKPSVKSVISSEIISNTNLSHYKTIIIVSTILDFRDENFQGTLYILLKPKTIQLIKEAAELFFEEEE